MLAELDLRVRAAQDAVGNELRRLGRGGAAASRLYALALQRPTTLEDSAGPAICLSSCALLGGPLGAAMPSAAALELYRGVFGGSQHAWVGVEFGGLPSRQGDGRLSLALEALLDNTHQLSPEAAIQTLSIHAEMAREFTRGKQTVAAWIREDTWDIEQLEYVRVVCQTRAWSAFVAPALCGATIARPGDARILWLRRFAVLLGVALCVLREAQEASVGPGFRSLPMLHAVKAAEPALREELIAALARPGRVTDPEHAEDALRSVTLVQRAMRVAGSVPYARAFARDLAERARNALERACAHLPPSEEREFFEALVEYVLQRTR